MSGDFDMMKPFFDYYWDLLPIRQAITTAWFEHEGVYYRENIEPTGGERDCGRDGKPLKVGPGENRGQGYYHSFYFTSGLETLAMMIDYVKYTNDTTFRDDIVLPFAREVLCFFEKDVVVYEPQELSAQVTTTGPESAQIPANELDLRIGLDHSGSSRFMGQIGRATIFRGAISPETIAALAQSNREEKIQDGQAVTCVLSPKVGDVLPFDHGQLGKTVSFEAWIKPADRESGRLFDKLTAGQRNGFLIDCWPKNSIRLIVGPAEKVFRDVLRSDHWQHIAVIIGPNHLEAALIISWSTSPSRSVMYSRF